MLGAGDKLDVWTFQLKCATTALSLGGPRDLSFDKFKGTCSSIKRASNSLTGVEGPMD